MCISLMIYKTEFPRVHCSGDSTLQLIYSIRKCGHLGIECMLVIDHGDMNRGRSVDK
jgi:hypothetical protein